MLFTYLYPGDLYSNQWKSDLYFRPVVIYVPFMIQRKPDCWIRKQKGKDKPITMFVPMLCDWFSSSASASDSDHLRLSLHHKRTVSNGVVSRIETLFSLDHKLYASEYDQ